MVDFPRAPTDGSLYKKKSSGKLTSQDLLQIANENGVGEEAQQVIADRGEDPKEIFSGGLLMDFFDALNAMQYGIVGMLKGKTFSEGVKTRQSFSDKDALGDNGIPGFIAGVAMDILFDPMTYFPPTFFLKRIPGAMKAAKAIKGGFEVAMETGGKVVPKIAKTKAAQMAQWTTKKIWGVHGADPKYAEALQRQAVALAGDESRLMGLAKGLQNGGDEVAQKFPQMFKRMPHGEMGLIPKTDLPRLFGDDALDAAEGVWDMSLELQNAGVELKILKEADPSYMLNAYKKYQGEAPAGVLVGGKRIKKVKKRKLVYETPEEIEESILKFSDEFDSTNASKIQKAIKGSNPIKELEAIEATRKAGVEDILSKSAANKEDIIRLRQEFGENTESIVPLFQGMMDNVKRVRNAELYRDLNKTHGMTDELFSKLGVGTEGYTKLAGKEIGGAIQPLGDLAGKHVPTYMADMINEMNRIPTGAEAAANKLWAFFKWGKTAGNPAGHGRNIISNRVLNYWKLGMNPLDPRTWKAEVLAKKELFKKGGKYISEAKPLGWGTDTFASAELKHMFAGPDFVQGAKGIPGKVKKTVKKFMKKTGDWYQAAESDAKLTGYIYNRTTRGMAKKEAWLAAEAATFDYSAVGSLVRKTRESIWGVPFLTFGIKAAPLVAETALKHPRRISAIGKIKNAIENMADLEETTKERKNEPSWLRDGFYIKMPMKDKYGRSAYFDLTYIIPFGDLASGQFFERQINRETGLKESAAEAMIKKAPVINLITEIGKNQDFYGNKIWRESDSSEKQIADLSRHMLKMWMPPMVADQLPGGHITRGKNKGKRRPPLLKRPGAAKGTQFRTGLQEIMRNTGLKIQPIDADLTENFAEWNKQRALNTFLGEKGLVGEFTRNYRIKK